MSSPTITEQANQRIETGEVNVFGTNGRVESVTSIADSEWDQEVISPLDQLGVFLQEAQLDQQQREILERIQVSLEKEITKKDNKIEDLQQRVRKYTAGIGVALAILGGSIGYYFKEPIADIVAPIFQPEKTPSATTDSTINESGNNGNVDAVGEAIKYVNSLPLGITPEGNERHIVLIEGAINEIMEISTGENVSYCMFEDLEGNIKDTFLQEGEKVPGKVIYKINLEPGKTYATMHASAAPTYLENGQIKYEPTQKVFGAYPVVKKINKNGTFTWEQTGSSELLWNNGSPIFPQKQEKEVTKAGVDIPQEIKDQAIDEMRKYITGIYGNPFPNSVVSVELGDKNNPEVKKSVMRIPIKSGSNPILLEITSTKGPDSVSGVVETSYFTQIEWVDENGEKHYGKVYYPENAGVTPQDRG